MIYQIQQEDVGRHTIRMGVEPVAVPGGTIKQEHVGKVLRYRRQKPVRQRVDIVAREVQHVQR